MGHEVVDGLGCEAVAVHHIDCGGVHVGDGVLVDVAAILEEEVAPVVKGLLGGGLGRSAAPHHQVFQAVAVDVEHRVDDSGVFLCRLHEHACRAVAEEWACRAVFVVDHRGHLLGCHHDHFLAESALDVGGRVFQGHDESGAGGLDVICVGVFQSGAFADDGGGGGEAVVGV